MLGEFLEISVATQDILAAVEFYERLGFKHAPVGETWQHPYGVLTDGRVAVGLHQYAFASPSLTFVLPELRRKLQQFESAGIEFAFCKIAEDEFNEAGFTDPDGQMVTLLEARTYSPLRNGVASSLCGYFLEYRMSVHDCRASCAFWERIGMVSMTPDPGNSGYVQMARSGLNLGLLESRSKIPPQLVFIHDQPDTLLPVLEARGVAFQSGRDHDGAVLLRIAAPDGLELLIRDRD
jgi:hypothetical protein